MDRETVHVGAEPRLVALSLYGRFGVRARGVDTNSELVPVGIVGFGFGVFEYVNDVHLASLSARSPWLNP